jgi:hypothetical protein
VIVQSMMWAWAKEVGEVGESPELQCVACQAVEVGKP